MSNRSASVIAGFLALFVVEVAVVTQLGQLHNLLVLLGS